MNNQPELPKTVWIDQRYFTAHGEGGEFRIPYRLKETKPHKHYKTQDEIAEIKRLSNLGLSQKDIASCLGIQTRTVRKYAGRIYSKPNKATGAG